MATESNTKETKIVRATPKKTDSQQEEQPRVTVKAAVKPQVRTQTKQAQTKQASQEKSAQRPPMGKPVANKELEGRSRMPIGRPVVPKEVAERGRQTQEPVLEKPAEVKEIKTEEPKTQALKPETVKPEAVKTEAAQKETAKQDAPKPQRSEQTKNARPVSDNTRTDAPARSGARPARKQNRGETSVFTSAVRSASEKRQTAGSPPQRQASDNIRSEGRQTSERR